MLTVFKIFNHNRWINHLLLAPVPTHNRSIHKSRAPPNF